MPPKIQVDSNPSLADKAVAVSISGLNASQEVTLHAKTHNENGAAFESISHYIADETGCVNLLHDKSHGGTYEGVWPMGPISFMIPSPMNKRKFERFMIKDPMKPFIINLRVFDTFISRLEEIYTKDFKVLAELDLIRTYATPGVIELEIHVGRVRGTLYLPSSTGTYPGVISVSGGYPGAMKHKAALLASNGFTALALKYFGTDDLPDNYIEVDLGYFVEAAQFLRKHPSVDGKNGIGFVGNCAGATYSLAAATIAPPGLVNCVVAISGWFFVFGNYGYGNQKWNTSIPFYDKIKFITHPDGVVEWTYEDKYSILDVESLNDENHFAIYDRKDTAFMFIYGGQDGYLPANEKIGNFLGMLFESAKHPNYKMLFYQGAGHLIENAFYPLARVAWTLGVPDLNGGKQPDHTIAQDHSWPKILQFVRENLTKNRHKL